MILTRKTLLALSAAGIAIALGATVAINHGASAAPHALTAQQKAQQAARNAWSDPETNTGPAPANPFPKSH